MNDLIARLFTGLLWLAARLPRRHTVRIAKLLARISAHTEAAEVTRINLRTCFPELNEEALADRERASLMNMYLMFFEVAQLRYWNYDDLMKGVTVRGESDLAEASSNPAGTLLIVPHLGNWELMCAFLGQNYRLGALYDRPKVVGLEAVIVTTRQRFSGEMFPIDMGGLRRMMKWLRGGGLVAVLPDQVPDRNAGVYADFFGQPALTMTLVHQLLDKSTPALVMGWARRNFDQPDYTYELCFRKLELPPIEENNHQNESGPERDQERDQERDKDKDKEQEQLMTANAINRAIEAAIAQAPEQYQWEYKRFKRPPTLGKTSIYRRQ